MKPLMLSESQTKIVKALEALPNARRVQIDMHIMVRNNRSSSTLQITGGVQLQGTSCKTCHQYTGAPYASAVFYWKNGRFTSATVASSAGRFEPVRRITSIAEAMTRLERAVTAVQS